MQTAPSALEIKKERRMKKYAERITGGINGKSAPAERDWVGKRSCLDKSSSNTVVGCERKQ